MGQKLLSMGKSMFVSSLSNFALWTSVEDRGVVLEIAGKHFVAFEVADLILSGAHELLDVEHVLHHILHIALGAILIHHCGPARTSAVLLAQETSGIFLNCLAIMRNRGMGTMPVKILFAASFLTWRVWFGTRETVAYWSSPDPRGYSRPASYLLGISLVFGTAFQWYWGTRIVRLVARAATTARRESAAYAYEDCEAPQPTAATRSSTVAYSRRARAKQTSNMGYTRARSTDAE